MGFPRGHRRSSEGSILDVARFQQEILLEALHPVLLSVKEEAYFCDGVKVFLRGKFKFVLLLSDSVAEFPWPVRGARIFGHGIGAL